MTFIPFVLGLIMFGYSVKEFCQVNKFVKRGAHTDGVVASMKKGPSVF